MGKWSRWLDLVKVLAPIVLVNVKGSDKLAPIIPVVIGAISEAEQIKGASGAEKKAHVLNVVDAAIQTANATGKVTLDAAGVKQAASDGIDAVVGVVNAMHKASPQD